MWGPGLTFSFNEFGLSSHETYHQSHKSWLQNLPLQIEDTVLKKENVNIWMLFTNGANLSVLLFKERVHTEMKTCGRLGYCTHIQPLTLISPKSAPTFPDIVSVPKICASGSYISLSNDLNHAICRPASEHPDLHRTKAT